MKKIAAIVLALIGFFVALPLLGLALKTIATVAFVAVCFVGASALWNS